MNKLILISVIVGAAVIIFASLLLISENPRVPQSKPIYEVGFTFNDVDKIRKSLSTQKFSCLPQLKSLIIL